MVLIITHNNERTLNSTILNSEKLGFIVHPVNDGPHYKTVIKAYTLASTFTGEWFVLMGGDQYLLDNAMDDILNAIKDVDDKVFCLSGTGYDYLNISTRMMAPVIYRVGYMKEALRFCKQLNDKVLRPESFVVAKMKKKGYISVKKSLVVANHDFDQYYIDIYNKGKSQAARGRITDNVLSKIQKSNEIDHKIFLQGINDFRSNTSTDIFKKFNIFNIVEKDPL